MGLYVSGYVIVRRVVLADFGRFSVCGILKLVLVLNGVIEGVPMGIIQCFGIIGWLLDWFSVC